MKNYFLSLLPVFIVLGIIDYRFSNYFWPGLDFVQVWSGAKMFDFLSVLTVYCAATVLVWMISGGWQMPLRWFHGVIGLILTGLLIGGFAYSPVEPQIKSFWVQMVVNYFMPIAVFLVAAGAFTRSGKLRDAFIKVFLVSFSILGVLCIFQFFSGVLPGESKDFLGRAVWPYIDPFSDMKAESANWLAYLFGPTLLLSAVQFFRSRSALYLISFVIAAIVLFLSKSYTGLFVSGFLVVVLMFFQVPKKWRVSVLAGALIAGVLLVVSQWNTPKFQVLLGNYELPNSIERRVQIYSFTWEMMGERLVQGIGIGNYQSFFRAHQGEVFEVPIPEIELPPHPHNLLMNAWSDLGIAGLLGFLVLYGGALWFFLKDPNKGVFFLVFMYPLGHGVMDVPYGLEEVSQIFWILLALAASSEYNPPTFFKPVK
ncbi:O-antigen ligase family protein [Patescibacteria group bacterium]|nr:O-antigen ligase family protein [Patescibacteria group bacterium]